MKVIYLGAGEFWLTEAVFGQVRGVMEVIPGYMGGEMPYPTAELVATGMTGHAEVVQIVYDDHVVRTEDLLRIFYALHDPVAPKHSGGTVGSQYRSVIFYTDEIDGEAYNPGNGQDVGVIERVTQDIQNTFRRDVPISTEIMTATEFYPADERQYNYYLCHPDDTFSVTIIEPALQEVKAKFSTKFL